MWFIIIFWSNFATGRLITLTFQHFQELLIKLQLLDGKMSLRHFSSDIVKFKHFSNLCELWTRMKLPFCWSWLVLLDRTLGCVEPRPPAAHCLLTSRTVMFCQTYDWSVLTLSCWCSVAWLGGRYRHPLLAASCTDVNNSSIHCQQWTNMSWLGTCRIDDCMLVIWPLEPLGATRCWPGFNKLKWHMGPGSNFSTICHHVRIQENPKGI